MAKYLVTGGCGFIGSHLADSLVEAGHHVCILDNLSTGHSEHAPARAELVIGDVTNAKQVDSLSSDVDGIFHLAAIASVVKSNEEWLHTHRTNLTATIHVFEAARARTVPVVYASSAAVYGDSEALPLCESRQAKPQTAYGVDKYGCELHGVIAANIHNIPNIGLRFFNVFGPRQDPASPYSGVISIFANCLQQGRTMQIYGDGEQVRDFIYVSDIVSGLRASMDALADGTLRHGVFNLCRGEGVSVNKLAKTLYDIAGKTPDITYAPPRAGEIRHSIGAPDSIADALNVRAQMPLEEGLIQTLNWLDDSTNIQENS